MIYRHGRDLVYRYEGGRPQEPELPEGLTWAYLTVERIDRFFKGDARHRRWYQKFLRQGCIGLVVYNESGWVAVGWLTTPTVKGPWHLPNGMQRLPAYWFFEDLVRPEYRGQRLHGLMVRLRVWLAHAQGSEPEIFSDVETSNFRSRRTYLSEGFSAAGIVDSYCLTIPRVRSFVVGHWEVETGHPALEA